MYASFHVHTASSVVKRTISFAAGPYSVNGVPMRRVNQAYVIATSMSIDVSKVTIPAADDSYFTREETAKKTDEDQFFEQAAKVRQPTLVQEISQVGTRDSLSLYL